METVAFVEMRSGLLDVPICWGTQLNGNTSSIFSLRLRISLGPYLLGNTVEWKHRSASGSPSRSAVPICWGTQLNGNAAVRQVARRS